MIRPWCDWKRGWFAGAYGTDQVLELAVRRSNFFRPFAHVCRAASRQLPAGSRVGLTGVYAFNQGERSAAQARPRAVRVAAQFAGGHARAGMALVVDERTCPDGGYGMAVLISLG